MDVFTLCFLRAGANRWNHRLLGDSFRRRSKILLVIWRTVRGDSERYWAMENDLVAAPVPRCVA